MAAVRTILANKGPQVWTIHKEATVLEAARLMNEHRVGCLVVLDSEQVTGIFTERDVLQRVVAQGRDPTQTLVSQAMTQEVVCCTPETSLEEARGVLKNRFIRHLPVVDSNKRLVGLVSIGDLNAYQATDQEKTIHLLHEYLYGRV